MKILVGTDGSTCSEKAIEFASRLAIMTSSSLTLLHVIPMVPSMEEEIIELIKEELGSPEDIGQQYLERGIEISKKHGVKAEKKLLTGHPAEEILDEAERGKYELIVVGSTGKGMINELLLGSVSSELVHHAKVPVLVVR
ncbi:MAG: universal stress protein [Candidatus Hydrothermarchaeaceae archaeon]